MDKLTTVDRIVLGVIGVAITLLAAEAITGIVFLIDSMVV